MAKYEHELRAFDGTGLDDVETDAALTYLLGFVQASARAAADARAAAERSALTDMPLVGGERAAAGQGLRPARLPDRDLGSGRRRARRWAGPSTPITRTHFGLERVLDGLGVLIEASGRGQ